MSAAIAASGGGLGFFGPLGAPRAPPGGVLGPPWAPKRGGVGRGMIFIGMGMIFIGLGLERWTGGGFLGWGRVSVAYFGCLAWDFLKF